jgi:hypothetical protein
MGGISAKNHLKLLSLKVNFKTSILVSLAKKRSTGTGIQKIYIPTVTVKERQIPL